MEVDEEKTYHQSSTAVELNQKSVQNDVVNNNDNELGKLEQSPATVDETVTADVSGRVGTNANCSPVIESESETVKMEVNDGVSKDVAGEEAVTDVKNDGENIKIDQGDEELINEDEAVNVEKSEDTDEEDTTDEDKVAVKRRRKRKRGGKSVKVTPKSAIEEEEDVCFICFDGGNLVLCDKKDCPKAYHPACIHRDEEFFKTKGKWNCGWHLCTICQKSAQFMCYTCIFSLCKTCIKTSVLYRIREKEKKGFCDTCMETIMVIENSSQKNQGSVDSDSNNSWKYVFKEYWTDVKAKFDFSLAELIEARNARKGSKPVGKQEPLARHSKNVLGSENPSEKLESQPRKTRKRKSKKQKAPDSDAMANEGTFVPETTEWASKELLEFVLHMGHDESYQSESDVQALLLEYIKTNKLRDTRRKSQIICDARLQRLFGKPCVGHFEMLKLLESYFLLKEDDSILGSVVNTEVSPVDDEERGGKDKRRKIGKKGDQEPQSNREDYASVDIHNINIIYLKRKLVEVLLNDTETFHSKVVGTFVRINISGANHKSGLYRLVQVTGTTKGEHDADGKKITDTMLEVLNLNKTESISIDTLSNQDFTEDECKSLRQRIKCGFINRPTVGNILDKAIQLRPVRVNDWFETEVVRLSHLRDQASDLGRKKEFRECVRKLELLKKPEERACRLQDIPIIHHDPTMDPKYESEEDKNDDDKKQGTSRSHDNDHEFTRNLSNNNFSNKVEDATSIRFKPHSEILSFVQPSDKPSCSNETKDVSESGRKVDETEKKWRYKDPSGKIQGLFSMAQLRKWNDSKFFPGDLRIWRKGEKEEDGILLTHALDGRFITSRRSPNPKQSSRHVGHIAGPSSNHSGNEDLRSLTPSSSQVPISLVSGRKERSQNQNQNLVRSYISQPSPLSNELGCAHNIVQNPQLNHTCSTPGIENKNWDPLLTGNVKPPSNKLGGFETDPGWVSPQPAQVVTPSQGWAAGNGNPNLVAPVKTLTLGLGSSAVNSNQDHGSPTENSNQGQGSSTPRDRHQQYNRRGTSGEKSNRGQGSGFHDNRKHWDFSDRGRPTNSSSFSDRSRGHD